MNCVLFAAREGSKGGANCGSHLDHDKRADRELVQDFRPRRGTPPPFDGAARAFFAVGADSARAAFRTAVVDTAAEAAAAEEDDDGISGGGGADALVGRRDASSPALATAAADGVDGCTVVLAAVATLSPTAPSHALPGSVRPGGRLILPLPPPPPPPRHAAQNQSPSGGVVSGGEQQ